MFRKIALRALSLPTIGAPVAAALRLCGRLSLSRKVMKRYRSEILDVAFDTLPTDLFGSRELRMGTIGGADQVARSLYWGGWRDFEPPLPIIFALCAREASHILDIGANTGFYSILGASANNDAVVHAFEPIPSIASYLRQNIVLNKLHQRVVVNEVAISDSIGHASIYLPVDDHGYVETSASLSKTFRERHDNAFVVPVVTIDKYSCALRGKIGLIKVDVEGLESAVLKGGSKTLSSHRPVLTIEVLQKNPEIEAIRAFQNYIAVKLYPDRLVITKELTVDINAPNQLFWPKERRLELPALAARAGLNLEGR